VLLQSREDFSSCAGSDACGSAIIAAAQAERSVITDTGG
jgi:hypothetical protein